MTISAIIPARGGSKGLPRKNVMDFNGKPMVAHSIELAMSTGLFDQVYVNTDDEEIATISEKYGATVMYRPEELGTDTAEVDPLINWSLEYITNILNEEVPDIMVLLYCTAPLRIAEDIVKTVNLVSEGKYDSALTLVEDHSYLWTVDSNGSAHPSNYIPSKRAARQSEAWNQYIENKSVYVFKSKDIMNSGCRINGNVGHYVMPKNRSIDIDSFEDYTLAIEMTKVGLE